MRKILIIMLLLAACTSICDAQIKKEVQQKKTQPKETVSQKKPVQSAKPQPAKVEPKKQKSAQELEAERLQQERERIEKLRREAEERVEKQRREEQERLLQLREMKRVGMELYATFDKPTAFNDNIKDHSSNAKVKFDYIGDTPSGKGKALYLHKDKRAGYNYVGWMGFEPYTNCTVSFWIKDFGTGLIFDTSNSGRLSRSNRPDNAPGIVPYFYCTSDGYFKLIDRGNPDNVQLGDVLPLKDGKWHLITVVMENLTFETTRKVTYSYISVTRQQKNSNADISKTPGICKLYVDGKIVTTHVSKTQGFPRLDTFGFGGVCSISSFKIDNASDMKLDNIRVYSRALSAEEVETIYREEQIPETLAKGEGNKQEEKINQVAEKTTDNSNTPLSDIGVEINGVRWATRNVDDPGTFAASTEASGKFYTWDEAQTVCPKGWRLPTSAEFQSLGKKIPLSFTKNIMDKYAKWTVENGVPGRLFGKESNQMFLPAAGFVNSDGNVDSKGTYGCYWSSTSLGEVKTTKLGPITITRGGNSENPDMVYALTFKESSFTVVQYGFSKNETRSVRCVAETD